MKNGNDQKFKANIRLNHATFERADKMRRAFLVAHPTTKMKVRVRRLPDETFDLVFYAPTAWDRPERKRGPGRRRYRKSA